MKIDCPHCGVHGFVDDSLTKRKLRCPQCSKVFLITEDILPEMDGSPLVRQEILSDVEAGAQGLAVLVEVADEGLNEERVPEAGDPDLLVTVLDCSVCGKSFAPKFMLEMESQLYCARCQPGLEDEGYDFLDGDTEDEDLLSEDNNDRVPGDSVPDDSTRDEANILSLLEGEEEDLEDGAYALETCSGCGESLHPEFLEDIGEKRYCALCIPEEGEADNDAEPETGEDEEGDSLSLKGALDDVLEDDVPQGDCALEVCAGCGAKVPRDSLEEVDSICYCGACRQEQLLPEESVAAPTLTEEVLSPGSACVEGGGLAGPGLRVRELLKEAWQKTKGAKASLWAALLISSLVSLAMVFVGSKVLQGVRPGLDPERLMGMMLGLQLGAAWVTALLSAGIVLIGVRQAQGQRVSWKLVFAGFSKALSITIAIILQSILVGIGFLVLVLPGIYLSVGYVLALPLILDKGMGPWEALEASRRAIHGRWWSVFGLYLLWMLITLLAIIPAGLGLIWVIPMSFVLIGVLYVSLFGCVDDVRDLQGDPIEETGLTPDKKQEIGLGEGPRPQ